MKKYFYILLGFMAGVLNGLLGAGGGMLIVPTLKKLGLDQRSAHATSICIIFPICVLSSIIYIYRGNVTISDALPYLPYSVVGSVIGSFILSKINQNFLKKTFGIFMICTATQLLFR